MAEKYQEENSGTQQENQCEYLTIIDDLSTELNSLSRQVNMVQKEFLTDEIGQHFESSLKVLETQNDMLQAAVETLIEERKTIERTLHTQNEDLKRRLCNRDKEVHDLKNRIAQLQERPCERCVARLQSECEQRDDRREISQTDSAEELQKLENELRRKGKTVEYLKSENVGLQQELAEIRRSQTKEKLLQRRRGTSVGRETNDHDVIEKLNAAQEVNKKQCRSLQKATREIASLHQEIEELRGNEDTFNKERSLLQEELIALKENQASQLGIQQSLQEQLQGTINELYVAKEKLQECMQVKDRIETTHRDELKHMQEINARVLEQYNKLVEDYNFIQQEYQKLTEIVTEKTNLIRAFNGWKEEQIHVDREVRKKMQMIEDHIKDMLKDKQNLLDRLNETEDNNRTLLQAMQQSRSFSMGNHHRSSTSPSTGYTVVAASSSIDPVSKVIENVRNTSRRLSQQRSILEDEESQYFSK